MGPKGENGTDGLPGPKVNKCPLAGKLGTALLRQRVSAE